VTRILITGARGFLGRNLSAHLSLRKDYETRVLDRGGSEQEFRRRLAEADVIFHLAGVNRPGEPAEFERANPGLTEQLCQVLRDNGRSPKIVFSSSIQAELSNPYGVSKAKAEHALRRFAVETGASLRIYRLANLFGKWCRPNYNSVTATFCHSIATDLPIVVSDPTREIELSYVDDVVAAFLREIDHRPAKSDIGSNVPRYRIQLGDLAARIRAFRQMRDTLILPDLAEWFDKALYATYLSYVPSSARRQCLESRTDLRGSLAEFIKQEHFGQIFVSRTKPGLTRGNHYHHSKTEKFFVVEGDGLIRMRSIEGGPIDEYIVSGGDYQVIDIPPGFTHSITNIGNGDLVALFWSSEIFDPNRTDTHYLAVDVIEQTAPKQAVEA
jgi:UDP-2-acetamido-2,6-beta-L-arabino-hexul-4-ose reductase